MWVYYICVSQYVEDLCVYDCQYVTICVYGKCPHVCEHFCVFVWDSGDPDSTENLQRVYPLSVHMGLST